MSKLALGLILAVASVAALPVGASAKASKQTTEKADTAEKAQTAPLSKEDQQKLREHVKMRNHVVKGVKYPATKEELVKEFRTFKDIKADDRKWFEETLPNKTFDSADEVMKALGWEVSPDEGTTASTASDKRGK